MIGGTKRMCEEFVLSNGLRVVAEPIENFPIRQRRPVDRRGIHV